MNIKAAALDNPLVQPILAADKTIILKGQGRERHFSSASSRRSSAAATPSNATMKKTIP
jgi:hypothetical protein